MAKLSSYGPNPLAGASRNNAAERGWGPGWPNAQEDKMLTVSAAGVKVRVRREISGLIQTLLTLTEARGYDVKVGQTWGFANRAIRGTRTPSNHSWGLAVDINSLDNPQSRPLRTNLPPAVVHDWEACHFYWGGRYTNALPDPMHFEYVGRPADVATDLKRARNILAALTKPSDVVPEEDTLSAAEVKQITDAIAASEKRIKDHIEARTQAYALSNNEYLRQMVDDQARAVWSEPLSKTGSTADEALAEIKNKLGK